MPDKNMNTRNIINDQLLHAEELAFFGKITASISHELNNVLSIINEYAGLLNDLCKTGNTNKSLGKERIIEISQNMAEQVRREQKLIKLLNRFAHRSDEPTVSFNLNELVNDIYLVTQRFCSMKKVTIELNPVEQIITITNNPYRTQFALFLCLQIALDDSVENDVIQIDIGSTKCGCIIKISSRYKDTHQDQQPILEILSSLLISIEGKIEYENSNGQLRITNLFLPLSTKV
jgi:C4-dicarboxylate-specific signal transduction histidine kinase